MVLYTFPHIKHIKTYKKKNKETKMELKNEKIYIQTIEKRERVNDICWYAITGNQGKRFSCFEAEVAKKLKINKVNLCKVRYFGKYSNIMSVDGYEDNPEVANSNSEIAKQREVESLRILKCVALKSASLCFEGQNANSDEVITKANSFVKWLFSTEDEGVI